MATSAEDLQRALEWAKDNNDQEAIDAVTAELNKVQGSVEPDSYVPGQVTAEIGTPIPVISSAVTGGQPALAGASSEEDIDKSFEQRLDMEDAGVSGPALRKPTAAEPWTKEEYAKAGLLQTERERQKAQEQYDADQALIRDPAAKPSREQRKEFIETNTDWRFGYGQFDSMQRQVVIDQETGKPRWTALSPDQIEALDKRGETTAGTIGALAYGSTRIVGASVQNAEAEADRLKNFQQFLVTDGLPESERDRIMGLVREKYGDDSRYVENPGLIPPHQLMEWLDQNPDNDKVLDGIAGNEWWEERKEFAARLGNRISAVVPGMPLNVFGADETMGALGGRGAYEGIEYEEGEAPAYPGASADLRDWRTQSRQNQGIYEGLIRPWFEGTYDKSPGEAMSQASIDLRNSFYSDEQEAEAQMPLLSEGTEINNPLDLWNAVVESAGDPNTKMGNPESLFLMFMENAPELGLSFAVTRGAGGVAARSAAAERSGQTLAQMNKAREIASGRAGMVAGGATEGILVQTHVEAETRNILEEIPDEVWEDNPLFQVYTEAGLTTEAAKQILSQDAASKAGTTAAAVTMLTGAPMNRLMAKSAAGRLVQSNTGLRRATGAVGEPVTEGAQEVMEMLQTEAAVRPIDPDNAIFKDPNRYWEAGLSGAIISLPFGAASALEPDAPAGINEADVAVARATVNYQTKTNERFAFELKITDPEHIANTTPNDRLRELEKLERMQEAEADALLKAEPIMREHLEAQPTSVAKTELQMLGRLKARANAVKTDIAVARSRRTNAASMAVEEQRILKDRAELQQRVNKNVIKLEDIDSLRAGIESVQNQEAVSPEQQENLISEGYARVTSDDQLVILPKGKRALKELGIQSENLRSQLDSGYTGPERRANSWQRDMVRASGPAQREQVLYTDQLTGVQNRRAFNERQENIDAREGQETVVPDGAQPVVAAVDVDSLAWVNDNMTHSAGDRLLQTISDTLGNQKGVEVFRLGGDEFAVTGASEQAVEAALQNAAKELQSKEIVSGEDAVTPQITWGKGQTYVEADTQSIAMKQDRMSRGIIAARKKKPSTYRHSKQQGLFQLDSGEGGNLWRSWNRAKDIVERGDSVEILTPDGAIQGIVTMVSNKRGRPRMQVNIQGRNFRFNPEKNWLIVDGLLDPADLAWITGDAEYAQPDRDSFPQVLADVQIGHLGKDGAWYADLADTYDYETPLPWWMQDYENDNYDPRVSHFVPKLPEASDEDTARAEEIVDNLAGGFANRPKINIVKSMSQLEKDAPDVVARIRAEGATLTGVRGYMDHIDPSNGIYIFVPNIRNIAGESEFEQGIIETVMHEMVGHYGIRGTFGNEADLRGVMHDIVDSFPRLAKNYATRLGLNPADMDDKQLLGEEMVAYIAGEVSSGKIDMTPKQKKMWQRFLDFIRDALNRMGMNRFSPIKKFDAYAQAKTTTLNDTKVQFWTDNKVQELIHRSEDFLRNGKGFEWQALNGSHVIYMRDGDIFQAGLITAINTGVKNLSRADRNQLKSKYDNDINKVPKQAPLFPDVASPNVYKDSIIQAQKEGFLTKREAELSGLDPSSDFYFFRDATYQTLRNYMMGLNGDQPADPNWYKGIVPHPIAQELDAINAAMRNVYMTGPLPQYGDESARPVLNQPSAEAMRNRIEEILNQKIDPKKTKLTKELLLAHMSSENVFRVFAEMQRGHPRISYTDAVRKLYGEERATEIENGSELTEEEKTEVEKEVKATRDRGYNIGYDKRTQRWLDWTNHTSEYSEWSPQGSRFLRDFRVALIKTAGMGTRMGRSGHYDTNLMHLRTGVAELQDMTDFEGMTFPNPEMEGRLLSLIELQSDWLQKLRKGFGSEDERMANERRIVEDRALLTNATDQLGQGITEDLWAAAGNMLKPVANLPDGTEVEGVSGGSLVPKLRERSRNEMGRLWEDLSVYEKKQVWKNQVVEELDAVYRKLNDTIDYLDQQRLALPTSTDLAGSMDARTFQTLDAMATRRIIDLAKQEINRLSDSVHNLRYAESQKDLVDKIQETKRLFGSSFATLASGAMDTEAPLRTTMATYQIEPLLNKLYGFLGADGNKVAERISAIQVREMATVRLPRQVVDDLNTAMETKYDSVGLLGEIFSPSRISRHTDILPGSISMDAAFAGDEFVDVKVVGNKADIQKAKDAIPVLIDTWITNHAQEKLDISRREARTRALNSDTAVPDPELDYETELKDWLNMNTADVEEGDSETSLHNVTTFYEFEERQMDEIHPEIVDNAFENMTEGDWDNLEGDYEGVSRQGDEYRGRLEVDEDGDVDNEDAEEYLDEQRNEYRRDVMYDDDDLRMQAYERIRDNWNEDNPPYLEIGSLPTEWDSVGDAIEHVEIMIVAHEQGDTHKVYIDGVEVDYFYSEESAQEALSEIIANYYSESSIIPPRGEKFHPEGYVDPDQLELLQENAKQPNWEIAKGNIVENISMMSDESQQLKKVYERMVTAQKKSRGGVYEPSPLGKDEQWRPIAFKYLVADAVRRGLGGVMWNNGLSSSTRGGMGSSDVDRYDQIAWTKETLSLRGEEQEVYVIHRPGQNRPLVVAKNMMTPMLGADVGRLIAMQESGKLPSGDVTKKGSGTERDPDFDPRDNYIIGRTADNVQAVYRRANNEFMGFAQTDEQVGAIIQQDLMHDPVDRGDTEEDAPVVKPVGQVLTQGVITREMLGSQIHVIRGTRLSHSFRHTYSNPNLAGARMSYEDITVKHFNKSLKKYGVRVKETFVKSEDMRKAVAEEGQATRKDPSRDEKIKEEHGEIYVAEMTGANHGWVLMSQKKGPLINDVFSDKAYADRRLTDFIESNYGTGDQGVRVMYFPITDQMREDFSGPVAPFYYDPTEDPALKSAAEKIGYKKTPLSKRIKQFKQGATATFQQGALDRFYGLKRALNEAGVDDGAYVSARLTTSLDGMMKSVLYHGHPVWKDGIMSTEGRGLAEIMAPIMDDPDMWGLYMAGKRAKGLMLEAFTTVRDNPGLYKTPELVKYNGMDWNDLRGIQRAARHFPGKTEEDRVLNLFAWVEQQEENAGKVNRREAIQMILSAGLSAKKALTDRSAEAEKIYDIVTKGTRTTKKMKNRGKSPLNEKSIKWMVSEVKKATGMGDRQAAEAIKKTLASIKKAATMKAAEKIKGQVKKGIEWAKSMAGVVSDQDISQYAKGDLNAVLSTGAVERAIQGGREHLFNAREVKAGSALGDKIPSFKRVAAEYAEFNKRVLDFAEASGLIDKETRPTWENADYVPFYRAEDDRLAGSSMSATAGIANQKSPVRRLRGSDQRVGDIVGNIMMNVTKLIDASVKNNAALESVDALRGSGIIQKEPLKWTPAVVSMKQVKKVLIDRGVIVPDNKEGIHLSDIPAEALEGFQKMFAINAPKGDGIISVMRDGKREYYYTNDMLLYRSLAAINKKAFGEWIQLFRQPKRLLTTAITIDPSFMLANFMRDTGSAYVLSRDNGVPVVGAIEGFNKALFEDETMRTLMSAGAAFENGFITGGDPRATRKVLRQAMKSKSFGKTVLDTPFKLGRAWLHMGASIENSNRVAVYQAAIRAGKSKKQAAYEAKDLMDFSMGGDWPAIQFLVQTVPFMNARAQGLYRLQRGATENPKGFAMKGMLVGLAGMAVYMAFKDDERYKELEMWDKHAYYHFWIGDNHYRLPKPFEVGAIFNTIPEIFMEYLYSKETDAGKDLLRGMGHMINETFNMSPIPQTFQPIREAKNNKSYFTNNPIVSYYESNRLPPDQYRYRTSPTMIELARNLPSGLDTVSGKIRSPLHLQNFYAGYTGTIGRYALQASDMLVRSLADYPLPPSAEDTDIPVWGRFIRGDAPARRTKYEREVYKLLDKTTDIQGSLSFHEKLGNVDEYLATHSENLPYIRAASGLESVRENIQKINKVIMAIHMRENVDDEGKPLPPDHEDYYSAERKRDEINVLEETRNNLFREGYKMRPGGEYNPEGEPVTQEQVIDLIDNFGVDNSTAYMRSIQESAPDTYELLDLVSQDLSLRNLTSLASAGKINE